MSRTVILWADKIGESVGGGHPEQMLGAPDANGYGLSADKSATITEFRYRIYSGFSGLLSTVVNGDQVTPEILAAADVIAFEGNGYSPAASGGWESCDWTFSDGVNPPLSVAWDEAPNAIRDPHILANGSITGAAYSAFFGFPSSNFQSWGIKPEDINPEELVISFLLFRLRPEIDTASLSFQIKISGSSLPPQPGVRECTPDPDAIGIVACHREDENSID
ncbi:MAG TPA: hypothetical protein P5121_22435 [Caldilineaceae bacterium]|nr:hypothetical protein [Caldilineaceae bacterium]